VTGCSNDGAVRRSCKEKAEAVFLIRSRSAAHLGARNKRPSLYRSLRCCSSSCCCYSFCVRAVTPDDAEEHRDTRP
jgi:hypothetical protein